MSVLYIVVTTTNQAITALKMLRENKNKFDLVISDVHMPDMDGFKLLELVGLEMDLPVISKLWNHFNSWFHFLLQWFSTSSTYGNMFNCGIVAREEIRFDSVHVYSNVQYLHWLGENFRNEFCFLEINWGLDFVLSWLYLPQFNWILSNLSNRLVKAQF